MKSRLPKIMLLLILVPMYSSPKNFEIQVCKMPLTYLIQIPFSLNHFHHVYMRTLEEDVPTASASFMNDPLGNSLKMLAGQNINSHVTFNDFHNKAQEVECKTVFETDSKEEFTQKWENICSFYSSQSSMHYNLFSYNCVTVTKNACNDLGFSFPFEGINAGVGDGKIDSSVLLTTVSSTISDNCKVQ